MKMNSRKKNMINYSKNIKKNLMKLRKKKKGKLKNNIYEKKKAVKFNLRTVM